MPQLWLSYKELGDMLDRGASAAVEHAVKHGWARRRCSDGVSRVKVPGNETVKFICQYAESVAAETETDVAVANLRAILREARREGLDVADTRKAAG